MSISRPPSNTTGSWFMQQWKPLAPYVAPPFAACLAIIPVMPGFIAKSALQRGESIPRMALRSYLWEGVKAAPTVGVPLEHK